ncbi:monocarboxylate transporter 5-like isoform X1 [Octopus vulgaris]|uniref:Monocarboxylate transporter 5-like isoform X1 n=1 Tax=Octopus vulgaris TaxID=6645 RepID=A0AA36B5V6_OCTVU|nr:monocarboxylate transporter 5-like isoform X1 [Octopus vulgaris]
MSVVLSNMEEMEVLDREREETNDDGDDDDDDDGNKSANDMQIEDGEKGGRKSENNLAAPCLNHNFVGDDADNDDDNNNDEKILNSRCFGRRCYFADLLSYFRSSFSTCRQSIAQCSRIQLFKCFIVSFCCFGTNVMVIGFIFALSIYYVELKLAFPNDLKYVTLAVFLPTGVFGCVGVISGYIVGKFGIRLALVAGSLLLSLGIIVCCFVPTVPYILVFLGFVSGTGCSLIYISTNTALAYHFPNTGRILISLITLGESFGLIIFPSFVSYLIDIYSWQGSFLVLGGTVLNCLPLGLIFSTKTEYFKSRKQSNKESSKNDINKKKLTSRESSRTTMLATSDSNCSCVLESSGTCKEDNCIQTEDTHDLTIEGKELLLCETKEKVYSTIEINGKNYPEEIIKISDIEKTPPLYKQNGNLSSQNSISNYSIKSNTSKISNSQTDISKMPKQNIVKKLQFLLSNKNYVLFLCTLFIAFGNLATVVTILPDYCYSIGLSVKQAAWIFSIGAIGDIISRVLGSLFLYLKMPSLVIFSFAIISCSLVSLIYPFITSITAITIVTFIFILTSGISFSVYTIVVLDFFNFELYSLSTGLSETVSGIGIILSGFSIGVITEHNNNDYTISFYIVSILNIVSMLPTILYYLYKRRRTPVDTQPQL